MKNRWKNWLVALTTIAVVLSAGSLCVAMEVHTTGYGTIYGDGKAAARDRAIEDAQRKAVEQAMGTMVSVETITQNYQLIDDRILSLASGYIQRYRIASEAEKGGEIEVTIVAEVGMNKLSDSMQAIKSLIRRMDKPKLMVLIAEQSIREEGSTGTAGQAGTAALSATSLGVAENALIEAYRSKGFEFVDRQALAGRIDVVDPVTLVSDQEKVRGLANLTDAQIVIFGQAQARTGAKVQGIYSGQANISLRALKTDTGEIIGAATAHAAVPFIDPGTANTKALAEASRTVGKKLLDQILRQWRAESGGTRNVALVIKGATYRELVDFRSWLPKYVRGVKGVHQRSVQGDTAELDIDLQGSAQNLADELSRSKFNDRSIEVQGLLPNKVSVELK